MSIPPKAQPSPLIPRANYEMYVRLDTSGPRDETLQEWVLREIDLATSAIERLDGTVIHTEERNFVAVERSGTGNARGRPTKAYDFVLRFSVRPALVERLRASLNFNPNYLIAPFILELD